MSNSEKIIPSKFSIRTSDRRTFRRCMRKWNWQSSLRDNLTRTGTEQNINFWFGSAIHFCMEDYHGYNHFGDPRRALDAYFKAFPEDDLPLGADVHYSLGMDMLTYYLEWLPRHNEHTGFETAWFREGTTEIVDPGTPGAVPAVEISFYIPLNMVAIYDLDEERIIDHYNPEGCAAYAGYPNRNTVEVPMYYHGTIDRIVKDRFGRIWLLDYKTAKKADYSKLDTDDQITSYLWAATKIFNFPVYGFVYLQLTKDRPEAPRRLKSGELSCDKKQATTHGMYRQALIEDYGEVNRAPSKMVDTLNHLAAAESPEGDKYVRWDFIKRSAAQIDATERAIYGELSVMLNTSLYCYPSPTRDCSWDCPFKEACIATDTADIGGLAQFMAHFEPRPRGEDGNRDEWRDNIIYPAAGEELVPLEELLSNGALYGKEAAIFPTCGPDGTFAYLYGEDE